MSDLQGSNPTNNASAVRVDESVHAQRISEVIPAAIKNASPATLKSILPLKARVPDGYMKARPMDRQYLKELLNERWRLQGELDELLGDLQSDIEAFGKRLLTSMLETDFNINDDPQTLSLHLYVPDKIIFGIDKGASRLRRSSLLAAALHNFEKSEAEEGAFRNESGVFRRDPQGNPERLEVITPAKFATLCRRLDIGGQYQTHLKSKLLPADPEAKRRLQKRSIASEKAAFRSSAFIARLNGDISAYAYDRLREVLDEQPQINFHGLPLRSHRLSLMGFRLTSIVLFSAVGEASALKKAVDALTPDSVQFWLDWSRRVPFLSGNEYEKFKLIQAFFANGPTGVVDEMLRNDDIYQQSRLTGPLIAYVPDDPDHPLKEYASLADFMKTLISQLRDPAYQAFFSRFVAQKDKGRFFTRTNERIKTMTWKQREPLDMGPWWRETAIENPDAEPITNLIGAELWATLFLERRDKALADARNIAVPTGDEDAASRWKRLTSYLDIGWNVFSFAAMLVPGLNEAVLGIMVAQMLAELAEGIEDWREGDMEEASSHINGVLINFAQLALMGAGYVLPTGAVTPVKASPFVEHLKPVQFKGKERLWNPDLSPYQHSVKLPEAAQANGLGLYEHGEQQVLRLDDQHYVVRQDTETGRHSLEHPTRPQAYQPVVEHNGAGSWKTELDQPLEWDKLRLLRRLGPLAEEWSDESLEQVLTVSGVAESALRRLHVEHDSPPAMLVDTFRRFKAWGDAGEFGRQLLAKQVPQELEAFVPIFLTELPRWPEPRAVELFEGPQLTGDSVVYGDRGAASTQKIRLTRAELRTGQLPQRVIESLNEQEIHALLGQGISSDKQARIEALQARLSAQAGKHQKRLFDALYKQRDVSADSRVYRIINEYPQLPATVAEELLLDADPADLRHLAEKRSLALRLREQARKAQARVRLSRAYEGLFLERLENADTRRLELASLATLPGWSDTVRIEVRGYSFSGELHASVGPEDARIRKVLVMDEEGRYQARDEQNQHLHGADDFYASLLRALPDGERKALGYDIYEGDRLRQAIQRSSLSQAQFGSILDAHPIRKPAYDPQVMRLRGGMEGYRQLGDRSMLRTRVSSLYPALTEEQVGTMLDDFGASADQRVSALEDEFNELNYKFRVWMDSPPLGYRMSSAGIAQMRSRELFYRAIRQCWQRTGPAGVDVPGIVRPQMLKLDGVSMHHLANMPRLGARFDHVTSLSLRNCNMINDHAPFLQPFRQLRFLDLRQNLMTRLPPEIGKMRQLIDLILSDNTIELTHEAVASLKGLTRLRSLGLRGNPLRLMPDIGRMPELRVLILENTGIDTWPTGLFAKVRPRNIYLDLRSNRISRIPEVAPGSFRAELLARTLVSRELRYMSPENLERLRFYTESVGLDPERPFPPRGTLDSTAWAEGMTEKQWQARQEIWDAVEDEFNSESFFDEIQRLTQSADFKAGGSYRVELTARVWRMLEAMAEDSELRTTIFAEAVVRTECVDGATQLFNVLGMKVLVREAYELANPGLIEAELVSLAKGKSRLDEIERIAEYHIADRLAKGEQIRRVDADGNVTGTIDVVEVHLAFTTQLAKPESQNGLDLPWQARTMQFRGIAGVTPLMIENARLRVLALEAGDLLRDSICEQPFWKTYMEEANRVLFRQMDRRMDALYEFKDALDERAAGSGLSPEEKDRLKLQVRTLASELGKTEADFAPGQVMTDEEFSEQYTSIKKERDFLLKQLTQQAMDRAKVQRVEIPFAVESTD